MYQHLINWLYALDLLAILVLTVFTAHLANKYHLWFKKSAPIEMRQDHLAHVVTAGWLITLTIAYLITEFH